MTKGEKKKTQGARKKKQGDLKKLLGMKRNHDKPSRRSSSAASSSAASSAITSSAAASSRTPSENLHDSTTPAAFAASALGGCVLSTTAARETKVCFPLGTTALMRTSVERKPAAKLRPAKREVPVVEAAEEVITLDISESESEGSPPKKKKKKKKHQKKKKKNESTSNSASGTTISDWELPSVPSSLPSALPTGAKVRSDDPDLFVLENPDATFASLTRGNSAMCSLPPRSFAIGIG
ncbi:hypothetical protein THAOC_27885, partial [Thalassiosira oceanica]